MRCRPVSGVSTFSPPPLEHRRPPSVSNPTPDKRSSQLQAPTRRLETRRIRGCYLPCPYPVPSDSGYLHYVTEHLRSRLGMELGIKATVEGVQVGEPHVLQGCAYHTVREPVHYRQRFMLQSTAGAVVAVYNAIQLVRYINRGTDD